MLDRNSYWKLTRANSKTLETPNFCVTFTEKFLLRLLCVCVCVLRIFFLLSINFQNIYDRFLLVNKNGEYTFGGL